MKTKNVIIGSGVVLGGVALYFLFFKKNKNSQGVSSVNTGKLKKQQKIVDDIESDLNDYEQRILDLGYSATSRGTFYKR